MKFSKWMIGAALLFSTQIASIQGQSSYNNCSPFDFCNIDICDMEFCGYADFLWWQVCRSDLDFDDDSETHFINPGYEAGWRVGAIARYECMDFGLRYTGLYSSDSKDGNKHRFDFDNLDIEFGLTCCQDSFNGYLRPFVGAKLAWIDEKIDIDDDKDKLDYEGYGLYLGLEGRYHLCNFCACDSNIPIAFIARASTGILHSEFHLHGEGSDDYKDECLYVPVHELYAAIDITFCDLFGCLDSYLQLGYEVQSWGEWRCFDSDDDMASLGFGGLVLRLGACF